MVSSFSDVLKFYLACVAMVRRLGSPSLLRHEAIQGDGGL